jgi:drug/metabolite transporter (DMT)-like permease
MSLKDSLHKKLAVFGIAALCFGYFAAYVPYSMMTKMITKGLFPGMDGVGFKGFQIQPIAVLASVTSTFVWITLARWWKHATHSKIFGISIARPQWFTFISGLCLSGVIFTTTLAYTFDGISIVFAMLLMRGGVLVMAPIVDTVARKRKRRIYWPSWIAAGLSLAALVVAFMGKAGSAMTVIAAINIGLYLFCYFFRFLFMSNRAKSDDYGEKIRFFVEEQMTANVMLFLIVLAVGLYGSTQSDGTIPAMIWSGFSQVPFSGYFVHIFLIGVFSYGTGLFGNLIYLDKRENTFTVPANRVSSIIAGVIATYALAIFFGQRYPSPSQLIGVGLVLAAIVFLSYRSIVEKRAKRASGKKR